MSVRHPDPYSAVAGTGITQGPGLSGIPEYGDVGHRMNDTVTDRCGTIYSGQSPLEHSEQQAHGGETGVAAEHGKPPDPSSLVPGPADRGRRRRDRARRRWCRHRRPGRRRGPGRRARPARPELAAAPRHAGGAVTEAKTAPLSPGELALQLQALLGQHAVLAADMMRGRLRDDPDFAQAANAALGKNTDAMGKLVGRRVRQPGRDQFTPLWSTHVTALFNYAARAGRRRRRGAARRPRWPSPVRDGPRRVLRRRRRRAGCRAAAAVPAVTAHIEHLIGQADAYAAKDWTRADQLYRQGYAHAFGLGKALAATLLPPDAAAVLGTPAWRLRSALAQLLGEHVELVVGAMRAGATDAADFAAAAAAVERQHHRPGRRGRHAVRRRPRPAVPVAVGRPHRPAGRLRGGDRARATTAARGTIGRPSCDGVRAASWPDSSTPRPATRSRPPRWPGAAVARHDAPPAGGRVRGQGLPDRARPGVPRTRTCSGWPGSWRTRSGVTVAARLPVGAAETGGGGTAPAPEGAEVRAGGPAALALAGAVLLAAG